MSENTKDTPMDYKQFEGHTRKLKIRVWNVDSKYIGDFEVSENIPELVKYGGKIYRYEEKWDTFIELKNQPVELPSLWTTNVK